jgi:hypothetical protein
MGPMDASAAWWATWWRSLVAASVGVALLALSAGVTAARSEAITALLEASSRNAEVLVTTVLVRELDASELAVPFPAVEARAVDATLQEGVFVDPSIARVRIWSGEGVIVFSSGGSGEMGIGPEGERPIDRALAGVAVSRATTEPVPARAGLDPLPTEIWETWVPLRTADGPEPQAVVEIDQYRSVIVSGTGSGAARLATALRVLAGLSFVAAVVLAFATARRRRLSPDPAPAGDLAPADPDDERFAMMEVAHERDVSIARATEAEDRERLARDRLAVLLPLEQRLEVAERRALDAERRLEEITERLAAEPGEEEPAGGGPQGGAADPSEAAARRAAELRARLGRGGIEKKRDP